MGEESTELQRIEETAGEVVRNLASAWTDAAVEIGRTALEAVSQSLRTTARELGRLGDEVTGHSHEG
jgi:hypothetical protein